MFYVVCLVGGWWSCRRCERERGQEQLPAFGAVPANNHVYCRHGDYEDDHGYGADGPTNGHGDKRREDWGKEGRKDLFVFVFRRIKIEEASHGSAERG